MKVDAKDRRSILVLCIGASAFGAVVAVTVLAQTLQMSEFSGRDRWLLSLTAGAMSILASIPVIALGFAWRLSVRWVVPLAVLVYVASINIWNLVFDEVFVRVLASSGSEGVFNYRELMYTHWLAEGGGIAAFGIGANALLALSLTGQESGVLFKAFATSCVAVSILFLLACAHVVGWFLA